jgi:hypothetical protein
VQLHTLQEGCDSDSYGEVSGNISYPETKLGTLAAQDWHKRLLSEDSYQRNKVSLLENRWVTLRGQKELLLPPDYNLVCSAVRGGALLHLGAVMEEFMSLHFLYRIVVRKNFGCNIADLSIIFSFSVSLSTCL